MKKLLLVLAFSLLALNVAYADDLFKLIEREEDPKSIISSDPNYDFEKALAKEVNDLSMYLGYSRNDKKIPLVGMFYETLQSNSSKLDELSFNNEDHFIVSGCRSQSCSEKSLLWIDKKNKIVVGVMLHYFLDNKATSKDENYLLIFSKKINSVEDFPNDFKSTLKTWVSSLIQYDYETKKNIPLRPTVINFINSKNKRITVANADDSYEAAFKKALDNHQYYFKHNGKNYTTDTKDKKFDFFDHGYKNYRSAAKYMIENYPDDKSTRCFIFKGKNWGFDRWKINKDSDKFYTYLDYDIDGWQNKVITTSANKLIKVIFNQDSGCYRRDTYIQVLFEDKIFYDSRKDFEKLTFDGWSIFLNINHYIDKDLNNNGKQELFIDAGYSIGNNWLEKYYLFEYDDSSIKLVKTFIAGDWTERLGVSDHFNAKFEVSDDELSKIIIEKFN